MREVLLAFKDRRFDVVVKRVRAQLSLQGGHALARTPLAASDFLCKFNFFVRDFFLTSKLRPKTS